MKVKELRDYLDSLDTSVDDAEIVRPSFDHYFSKVKPILTDAELDKAKRTLCEYYRDEAMEPGSTKVKVLVME